MKVDAKEFEQFWSEVFGPDWYIDDDEGAELDAEKDTEVELDEWVVAYQGSSPPAELNIPKHVKAVEFDSFGSVDAGLLTLFQRWRKAQPKSKAKAPSPKLTPVGLLPQAVCCLLVNTDHKILAISRRDDDTQWGLPGGKVEPNESLEMAIVRETFEETGYVLAGVQPVFTALAKGEVDYMTTAFTGRVVAQAEDAPRSTPFEGHVRWVDPSDLIHLSPFGKYNQQLLENIHLWADAFKVI